MKTAVLIFATILTLITAGSCKKDNDPAPAPTSFIGKWTMTQVYGNDSWGGPAYWKTAPANTKVEFTSDGKFFKKYPTDNSFTLIGSFEVLSDSTLKITVINPANSYTLNYDFSVGGYMTWGDFGTEAVIKEKYRLEK